VTISGDVRFNADFKIKSSKGGCTGGFKAEMCGFFSGGGGLKVCVGRKIFGEVCLELKLSCDVFGVCGGYGDGRSMPTSGKCTAKIAGSACIANGLLCGEMDIGNINFSMPFLE
jgi:hypothetical protein